MNRFLMLVVLAPTAALAADGPDERLVREALAAYAVALEQADFASWARHFDEHSAITMDMDPVPERGTRELTYEQFQQVAKIGVEGLENAAVAQEIAELQRDPDSGDVLVTVTTRIESDLMGMRLEKVTEADIRYNLVGGQLHIVSYEEEVLRSGPLPPSATATGADTL